MCKGPVAKDRSKNTIGMAGSETARRKMVVCKVRLGPVGLLNQTKELGFILSAQEILGGLL